jgi:uncharacterized protein (DUF2237 family)
VSRKPSLNVLGGTLTECSHSPRTGFYRDGCCNTGDEDFGAHLICTEVTEEFLEFSKQAGNDLSTSNPAVGFPGLRPGDRWCVCAGRWKEALEAGFAAPVVLEATHVNALDVVSLDDLRKHALNVS